MRANYSIPLVLSLMTGVLVLGFQNCASDVQFASKPVTAKSSGVDSGEQVKEDIPSTLPAEPVTPDDSSMPEEDVICDPFSNDADCSDPIQLVNGLKGNIYYLDEDLQNSVERSSVVNYIKYGLRVPYTLYMSKVDVAPRSWDQGFPSEKGDMVQTSDGETLFEWFALDLEGYLASPLPSGEEVQFALYSDDGSILSLDGEVIINNDGQHAPRWACADQPVRFEADRVKDLRLMYFQGPRYQIALQLMYRPWSENGQPCSGNGGWKVVPKEALLTK